MHLREFVKIVFWEFSHFLSRSWENWVRLHRVKLCFLLEYVLSEIQENPFVNCYLVRFWPRWPSSTVLIYPFTKNTSLDPNHVTFLFTLSASFELVCFSNFSQSNFDKLVFQLWFHFQCFVQDMLALIWESHCLIFQLVSSSHSLFNLPICATPLSRSAQHCSP